jgi:DNA repair protein RecN (Recombination protein N)
MIERLEVTGMGGITKAVLDFSGDFIVITGESGSGKSSLVRAFELISGKRASTSSIHAGGDEAEAVALWNVPAESGQLVTRRSISRSGKSRCRIGDELATAGQLAAVSAPMIEIQSQFAQLNLLDPARQLELVDQCGGRELAECRGRLAEIFPRMLTLEKEIIALKRRRQELEIKLEGAPERVRRIKSLGLYPNCEQEWKDELAALERSLGEAGKYENITNRMKGGEGEADLLEQLASALRDLYSVAPPEQAAAWAELGEEGMSKLQALFEAAGRALGAVSREDIERACEKSEARLGLLRKLKRETGRDSAEELSAYLAEVENETRWMSESAVSLDEKNSLSGQARSEIASLARRLRVLRESAAVSFADRVNRHLADLAMDDVKFSAEINKLDKVRAAGAESASFTLSQSSLPPNPVGRVASGGELSRILIAIQASIEPDRLPGTLVFDEVEAGLGGKTALLAGEKLRELSRNCRVILITHEATIAAMADQHFMAVRSGDETGVREISGEARVKEVARMLAGSESREAMEHARALLEAPRGAKEQK